MCKKIISMLHIFFLLLWTCYILRVLQFWDWVWDFDHKFHVNTILDFMGVIWTSQTHDERRTENLIFNIRYQKITINRKNIYIYTFVAVLWTNALQCNVITLVNYSLRFMSQEMKLSLRTQRRSSVCLGSSFRVCLSGY